MVPLPFFFVIFCYFIFLFSLSLFPFCSFFVIQHLDCCTTLSTKYTPSLVQSNVSINMKCSSSSCKVLPLTGSILPCPKALAPDSWVLTFLPKTPHNIFVQIMLQFLWGLVPAVKLIKVSPLWYVCFVLPGNLVPSISVPLISEWKTNSQEPKPMAHGERHAE